MIRSDIPRCPFPQNFCPKAHDGTIITDRPDGAAPPAERFIRALEENLLWVRYVATSEELRLALQEFRRLDNQQWLVERHGDRSPAQVRGDFGDRIPAVA
jgi:hypothetical protein